MVSLKTGITLAALGIGAALFLGAGSFKGVGGKIGGFFGEGFSDFSRSISSAFTQGLFGGVADKSNIGDTGTIGPPPRTGTEGFDPLGNLEGNFKGLQNILDSFSNLFTSQAAFGETIGTRTIQDVNLVNLTQASLGRDINVSRSVAATRLIGGQPVLVSLGGKDRLFATQESANSFIERFNR